MKEKAKTTEAKERNTMEAKVKVWDVWVRVFHWGLVVLVAATLLTSDDYLTAHAYAGYIILFLLAGRVLWGFIGGRYARFKDFIYPSAEIIAFLKDMARLRHKRFLGHNPAAGVMVLAIIASAAATAATGVVVYGMNEAAGPLARLAAAGWRYGDMFEEIHGFLAGITLALAGMHIAAAVFESIHYRENLVASMITGFKKKELQKEEA